ncbi:nucleotide sugar dehydrogenase [Marinihelvus fidelis]|uniref:Nucleotide sugar dehydrogenase n=1 Tax=Marinihelvus fidelis TaxID=2613842 RepID=A0A5N0TGR6_9GAMM|nr:nucleotide sugar dehydrogenase [Marinihelvus fidelis]KAA9133066.1 nucleotide sugar dehydrogenase [Marinihelvus fidelis]
MSHSLPRIAIIGLGYVGAPLMAAFARHFEVTGFDLDRGRVTELASGSDRTGELSAEELAVIGGARLGHEAAVLADCNVYIVTVPTPVTEDNEPDLSPLHAACEAIGPQLQPGDTVVFESTVYPGATEEVCVPALEQLSGLRGGSNEGFWYGYSPERINPGDRTRRLESIVKVVSGCCAASLDFIDGLYSAIVPAGTHRAPSVRVAEAAKVIENTQRDVNIALVNELAMLFDRLGLDTRDVLAAAGTKWNFLPFTPGLVGGHCIGVDPYYLTHKARAVGFDPQIILAGRGVNDGMATFVASKVVGLMAERGVAADGARVLVMGLTFKENCPDTRNSQVFRLIAELQAAGCDVDVLDPWVSAEQSRGIRLVTEPAQDSYDAVIGAVAHRQFEAVSAESLIGWGRGDCVYFDIKSVFGTRATARL